jgi:hypothetical protein
MLLLHRTKLLKTMRSGQSTAAAVVDQVGMTTHSFPGKLRRHQQHTTEWRPSKIWGRRLHETDHPSAMTALFAGQLGVKAAQADCKGLEG